MSSSPSSTTSQPSTNERLDVPFLPPSSSRFVLPPPPSDLLNRLQAFLPQIKSANEQLGEQGEEEVEEAVVMEELSSDSEDSSDEEEDSDDSSDEDEDDSHSEEGKEDEGEAMQQDEPGTLDRLMDINNRPKVVKKNLVVVEDEGEVVAAETVETKQEK
ncbi:hypothetical protein JCM16303_003647 [Sporobolomyces ruberrimus]